MKKKLLLVHIQGLESMIVTYKKHIVRLSEKIRKVRTENIDEEKGKMLVELYKRVDKLDPFSCTRRKLKKEILRIIKEF